MTEGQSLSIADHERLSTLDKLETRMLLMHVTGFSRIQLITRSDYQLSAQQTSEFAELQRRRSAGEPIAYLTGEREFFGLPFYTSPAVLIPRPDTELLVELSLQLAPQNSALLDLGTGSGAIAIAIAHEREDLAICAVDVSTEALAIANKNAARLLPPDRLQLLHSNWYSALAGRLFQTIVSNPPYIVKDDPHLSQGDLRFEPINALTDHADGLSAYRHIIGHSHKHLAQQGWLLMEHGYHQAADVRALLNAAGYEQVQSWRDLAGIERVTGGQRR